MSPAWGIAAVALVSIATLAIGSFGLRISRTSSDFYVASRSVSPSLNGSAISGEYLSAASYLGIAGLVLTHGADMLWYPIGWTVGYLLLLVFVAAPLRRSGAYTIPDFAQVRLQSLAVRRVSTALVVAVGWLYLIPQFQGAGLTLQTVLDAPRWFGTVLVAVIVTVSVALGGMRAITFVQAFQYWLKLTALLVPVMFLLLAWSRDGRPGTQAPVDWWVPLGDGGPEAIYSTYAVIVATFLGTMGLPHVVVRFYTNPDGHAARRTTLVVLVLVSAFYLLPTIYGVLGRVYASDLVASGRADAVVLELPSRLVAGTAGEFLTALVTAGAFAAFLSTSSGVTMALAGVVGQGLSSHGPWRGRLSSIAGLRVAAALCVTVPLALAFVTEPIPVASSVIFAFALAASTFCPLLVLGIWWRGLTSAGAIAGLLGGGVCAGVAPFVSLALDTEGWWNTLMSQPALWSVPVGFGLMVGVSLATRGTVPATVGRTMVRLHTPERVQVDRRF
ncbi:cation acetate symporter [Aeromicrobium sp. 636]|uniref:Cation acetate symporter n=1 Tax=Aeromicrobium senzhongii TaxID=2663859 RepID=A0A8I0EWW5_9ACTN|nr:MULTISPECIES: cation acetate symporter [Aeromicrobium]MBC9227118.1 cation acetate symporter [Aeromicrobium senzhongii]MCQ3999218.1 cation acetate symporter [Aeromicrobium sp. 636]MTB88475.1 cation acetate symporter [Aeromicrobium senzhongii]QNL94563.1 cation acetate symporter [Aeromicrobium senzhongii]